MSTNSSPALAPTRQRGGLHEPARLVSRAALWSLVLRRPAAAVWRRVHGLDVLVSIGGGL